jgi:PST family polysaccharide transporter
MRQTAKGVIVAPILATIMIAGYVMGLPYGPNGVAFAYSMVLSLWLIPHILVCVYGTPVSFWDVLLTVSRPMASGILAGGLAYGVRLSCGELLSPLSRLALEGSTLAIVFFVILLFVAGQKSLYLDLYRARAERYS